VAFVAGNAFIPSLPNFKSATPADLVCILVMTSL
jgi:hypothetical protein